METSIASVFDAQHNSRFLDTFHNFFTHQTMADVCFICKNGQKVKAHQMVLAVVSKLLKKILLEFAGTMQEIIIHLPDVSASSLKLVLYFLYEGATRLDGVAEYEEFQSVLTLLGIEPDNSSGASRQESRVCGSTQQNIQPAQQPSIYSNSTTNIYATTNYVGMKEPLINPQYHSGGFPMQGPSSVNEYHPGLNQPSGPYMGQIPSVPSSQPQIVPSQRITNQHDPNVQHLQSEPVYRQSVDYNHLQNTGPPNSNHLAYLNMVNQQSSSSRPFKRKQAPGNPEPAKNPNVSVKLENMDSNQNASSLMVYNGSGTTAPHAVQPPTSNQNGSFKNSSDPRTVPEVRGRGRPRGRANRPKPSGLNSRTTNAPPVFHKKNIGHSIHSRSTIDDCVLVDD